MPKIPYLKSQTRQTDWCAVIPKLAEPLKKSVASRLIENFSLSPQESQETLEHTPIILLDDLDHDAASRVQSVFEGTGVELILTQDPSFKKKCFRVLWPKESESLLRKWRNDPSFSADEDSPQESPEPLPMEQDVRSEPSQGKADSKKRISELEARLKIAEARNKELQGELSKREKNSQSREEVLEHERKVTQKLQALLDQGQKENTEWSKKTKEAQERIKALEAEKNDLSDKLQKRVQELAQWKVKEQQFETDRESLEKKIEQKTREFELRQRAFEQQISDFEKAKNHDKTGYADEKKRWETLHSQFQKEIQHSQQKSAELTEQLKALRRNITDREEASKLSAQSFKETSRKNQILQTKVTQLEGQLIKSEKIKEDFTREIRQISEQLSEKSQLYDRAVSVYENRIAALDGELKTERARYADEKVSLEKQIEDFAAEINILKQQKNSVEEHLREAEQNGIQLRGLLEKAEQEQRESLTQIKQRDEQKEQWSHDFEELQKNFVSLNQERAVLQKQLQEYEERAAKSEKAQTLAQEALKEESARLIAETENLRLSMDRIAALESQTAETEKLFAVSKQEHQSALEKIQGLEEALNKVSIHEKELMLELNEARQEIDRWRQEAASAESNTYTAQRRGEELESLRDQLQSDYEQLCLEKKSLEDEKDRLSEKAEVLSHENAELEQQRSSLQAQVDDLSVSTKALRANLDKRTDDLESSLRERERQASEWAQKYNELKEMSESERESQKEEQSRLESVLEAVREERTAALKHVSDLEALQAGLDQRNAGLTREVNELAEQLKHWTLIAEQASEKCETQKQTLEALQASKAGLESERDVLSQLLEQLKNEKKALENQLTFVVSERDQLFQSKKALEEDKAFSAKAILELEARISDLHDVKASLEVKLQEQAEHLAEVTRSLEVNTSLANERYAKIESLETQTATLNANCTELQKGLQQRVQELENAAAEIERNCLALDRLKNDNAEWQQSLKAQADAYQKACDEHEKVKAEWNQKYCELADKSAQERELYDDELKRIETSLTVSNKEKAEALKEIGRLEERVGTLLASQTRLEQNLLKKTDELTAEVAARRELMQDLQRLTEERDQKTKSHAAEMSLLTDQKNELSRNLEALNKEFSELTKNHEDVLAAQEQTAEESKSRLNKIEILEAALTKTEFERTQLQEAELVLKDQLESEQTKFSDALADRNRLQEIREGLENTVNALKAQLAEVRTALQNQSQELAQSLKVHKEETEDWLERYAQLNQDYEKDQADYQSAKKSFEEKITELEAKNAQEFKRAAHLEESLQNLSRERSEIESRLSLKSGELAQTLSEVERMKEEGLVRKAEQDALESLKNKLESEQAALEREKTNLLEMNAEKEAQNESLRNELQAVSHERDGLVTLKEALQNKIASLEELKAKLETQAVENQKSYERHIVGLEADLEHLKGLSSEEEKKYAQREFELKEKISQAEAEKETVMSRLNGLEKQLEENAEQKHELEEQLQIRTEEALQWKSLAAQSDEKSESRRKKIEQLEIIRDKLENGRERLEAERLALTKERDELTENLDKLTVERQELIQWKDSLSEELGKLKEEAARFDTIKAAGESQLAETREALQKLSSEKASADERIQSLDEQILKTTEEKTGLEETLSLKMEELNQWKALAEQNDAKAESRQQTILDLEASYKQLEDVKSRLEAQKSALSTEKDQLAERLSVLTDERRDLSELKEHLETELQKLEERVRELLTETDQQRDQIEKARLQGRDLDADWTLKYNTLKASSDAELAETREALQKLSSEKASADERIQSLDEQILKTTEEKTGLEETLSLKMEELNQWKALAEQNEAEAEARQQTILDLEASYKQLEDVKSRLEAQTGALSEEKNQLAERLHALASEHEALNLAKDALEADAAALKQQLKQVSFYLNQQKEQNEILSQGAKEQNVALTEKYEKLQKANQEMVLKQLEEREKLESSLNRLLSEKADLGQKAGTLEKQLEIAEAELEEVRNALHEKTEALNTLLVRAEQAEDQASSRQEQVVQLEAARKALDEQSIALRASKSALEIERQALLEKFNQTAELKNLADHELTEVKELNQQLRDEVAEYKQKAADRLAKIQEMQKTASEERDALVAEQEHFKTLMENLRAERTAALASLQSLELQYENSERRKQELETEVLSQGAQLKHLNELAEAQNQKLNENEKQRKALESVRADLSARVQELADQKDELERELALQGGDIQRLGDDLKLASEDNDIQKKTIQELQIAKERAEARCSKMEDDIRRMNHEKEALARQAVEIQSGLTSLEMEDSLKTLESRRKHLESELETKITELDQWMREAASSKEEVQILRKREDELVKLCAELEQKCGGLEAKLKQISETAPKQIDAQAEQIRTLQNELNQTLKKYEEVSRTKEELVLKNEHHSGRMAQEWDERYKVLKDAIVRERDDFERERAELRKKHDSMRQVSKELESALARIAELEQVQSTLQKKLTESTDAVNQAMTAEIQPGLQQQLTAAANEIKRLTMKYDALEEIKNEFVGLLGAERKRYDDLQNEYDLLKERFGELVRRQTEAYSVVRNNQDETKSNSDSKSADDEASQMQRLKKILDLEESQALKNKNPKGHSS